MKFFGYENHVTYNFIKFQRTMRIESWTIISRVSTFQRLLPSTREHCSVGTRHNNDGFDL